MKTLIKSVIIISILAVSGCKKSNTSLDAFQPQINNITDNFQFQATQVINTSTILYYNWNNTGVKANIDKSGIISSGDAKVTIYDANNTQVYFGDLKATGSEQSLTGVTGTWKIKVELASTNGDLNFRVQKG